MAQNLVLEDAAVNAEANALAALLNSGKLRIYETASLLAELTFNATAFGGAAAGVIAANAITADSDADASGTANTMKCYKSDGSTLVLTGTVGTADADLILDSVVIAQHATVTVSGFELTIPKSA